MDQSIRVYYCVNAVQGSGVLSGLESEPDVAIESVPCTGRIDPRYLLKAFEAGARAVCILGCPIGCCKSIEGNLRAVRRVRAAQEFLVESGFGSDSLDIYLADDQDPDEAVERVISFIASQKAHEVIA
jgi:coenzyme F420-reducing hydrogenase delta subunit